MKSLRANIHSSCVQTGAAHLNICRNRNNQFIKVQRTDTLDK